MLILLIVASGQVGAHEWFVAPGGDDTKGNGSLAKPFRTLGHVLNTPTAVVARGDTVTLRGGTYDECDVRLRVPLTLRARAGEHPHIYCDMKVENGVVVQVDPGASGSRVAGLELSGGMYYGVMLQTNWSGGDGTGPSDIVLEHLKIHDTGRDGIKITPKSSHVTIRDNEIWNTGASFPPGTPLDRRNAEGIDIVNASFVLIEDNYIHDISTTGLYFKGGSSDVTVQRNRVENTGMSGILDGFDTSVEFFDLKLNPQFYESIRSVVRNNLVRNTPYAGIGLYAAKDAVIANNTIIDTAREGHAAIYFGIPFQDWDPKARRPPTIDPLIRNNLVIQDGGACIEIRWSDELGGLSALTGSPNTDWNGYYDVSGAFRFVDMRPHSPLSSGGSFGQWKKHERTDANSLLAKFEVDANGHLPGASPAIDRGVTLEQVVDDIDRDRRTAPYDIGADERTQPGK